ncbi:MAG: hypothetical protein WAV18_26940, partial [Roseiarcus sp.]
MTAERKLRILERLTSGLSVGHIAGVEQMTIPRVRQKREVISLYILVQLQIARVPHTMMMRGDLQAMDRLLELNGELDHYHGFGRAHLAASAEA